MQKNVVPVGIFAALAALAVFATACGQSSPSSTASSGASPQPSSSADGKTQGDKTSGMAQPQASASTVPDGIRMKAEALYKSNCMTCHAENLQGDAGPNLQKVGARRTKEEIVGKLTRQGKVMPNFKDKLDGESIEALAVWLAAKK